jgi:phage FluMu protein Com
MIDIRCVKCKALLMKADKLSAEVKCRKCGYTHIYSIPLADNQDYNAGLFQEKYKPLNNY